MVDKETGPRENLSALSLGLNLAIGMTVFTWGGIKIDQLKGTEPLWSIFGISLGLAYIFYELWKLIRKTSQ